ncbi:MAG: hypothetical protein ACE37J_14065 [Pikeienuella sp.]|uniref:hypothetical protein n=1 Tax=Pikeienuella sp. TaxID=2831957 RepID=UPI00391BD9B1
MIRPLILAALIAAPAAAQERIAIPDGQQVIIRDGDTIRTGGVTYRFPGVDAAEMDAPCEAGRAAARAAREALAAFIAASPGRWEIVTTGEACGRGRPCADIEIDGRSAIAAGLESGWLRPWPSCGDGRCDEADRPDWCEGG